MASQLCRGPHCSPGERHGSLGHTRISGEALVTHSCRKIICMLYEANPYPGQGRENERGLRWERKFQSVLRRWQAGRRPTPPAGPIRTWRRPQLLALCLSLLWWALGPISSLPLTDEKCLPPLPAIALTPWPPQGFPALLPRAQSQARQAPPMAIASALFSLIHLCPPELRTLSPHPLLLLGFSNSLRLPLH